MDWPLLSPLPPEARNAVLASTRRRTFRRGEVVVHEGDPADALHLVTSGHLLVQVASRDGARATLNVLGPGAHVGELALIPGAHVGELALIPGAAPEARSATVSALDAAETLALSAAAFHDLRARFPPVAEVLIDLLAQRVRELSERLLETMYTGLDRRVYRCLLRLGAVYAEGAGPVVVPMTQDQVSDLVGGTRPSVNQVLQRLRDQGVIELGRGRVVLLDREALARKAGT